MWEEALKELKNNPVDIIFFIRFLDVIWTANEEDHCQQSIVNSPVLMASRLWGGQVQPELDPIVGWIGSGLQFSGTPYI